MCWSTRRRTPTPRSGRSSSGWSRNFSAGRAKPTGASAPCSWSATSSRRSTASRGPTRERFREAREMFKRGAALDGGDDLFSYRAARAEFRDLSIAASFRSAQPVLDVVDAVIETVGPEALALEEAPPPHRAHHADRPGSVELWQPFAVEESPDDSDEGEERWVSAARPPLCRRARRAHPAMVEEAPVLGLDRAAADAGRHPGAGPQPRRARLADRRAAVLGRRSGRRRRPAAPARAAGGAGPARRGEVRGSAERRSEPGLPAGLAADRLGPGAAARACLRPQGIAVARASPARGDEIPRGA